MKKIPVQQGVYYPGEDENTFVTCEGDGRVNLDRRLKDLSLPGDSMESD
ncbi:MAG: hypothetical protein ACOC0D_06160 [Spirochaeta sp.]